MQALALIFVILTQFDKKSNHFKGSVKKMKNQENFTQVWKSPVGYAIMQNKNSLIRCEKMLQRIRLFPGVGLTAIQSTKFKTGCFSVNLIRPLSAEEAAKNALIPNLLLRGCGNYPNLREISRFLEGAYGANVGTIARKKGEAQVFGLYADYLEDEMAGEPLLSKMIDFVGGLLFDPVTVNGGFEPEAFATELENQRNQIASAINDKRVYAVRQLFRTMFRAEPYRTPAIGNAEDLEGITAINLMDHYLRILPQTPIELFYMGSADLNSVSDHFRRMLVPLKREPLISVPPVVSALPGEIRCVSETQSLSQSKLAMGFRMRIPQTLRELAATQLFLTVYGSGSNSKLFRNVREAQSLCYYASASFDRYKGVMIVSSGIDAEQYDAALSEIRRQLRLCAEGEITEEEISLARTQLLSQMRAMLDNSYRLEEFYIGQAVYDRNDTAEELLTAISQTTRQEIIAAAQNVREDTVFFLKGVKS